MIQEFSNQIQEQPLFRPMLAKNNKDAQILQQGIVDSHPVVTAKDFLAGLQMGLAGQAHSSLDSLILTTEALGDLSTAGYDQLIDKISRYISQKMVAGAREINLSVKHRDIGDFKIHVAQAHGAEGVQLTITVFNQEGANLFGPNQANLIWALTQKGVQVEDFKLEQQVGEGQDDRYFSHDGRGGEESQYRQDSRKRRELWGQASREIS